MPLANEKKRRNSIEHDIQCAFMDIISYTTLDDYLFAIPNGGKRNIIVAARMKKEGVKKGVLDTFLSLPSLHYHGFYIEFKAPGGKLTDEQEESCYRMTHAGYLCMVFTDAMEAYTSVKAYSKNEKLDNQQWKGFIKKRRIPRSMGLLINLGEHI